MLSLGVFLAVAFTSFAAAWLLGKEKQDRRIWISERSCSFFASASFFVMIKGDFFTVRYLKGLTKCKKYERFVSEKIKKLLIE